MKPNVSIVILNWNGWKDTVECLESLYQINYLNYNVIVLDNASSDGSIKKIKEYCEGKLKVQSSFFEYNLENKPIKFFEYEENRLKEFEKNKNEFESINSNKKLILILNNENYGFAKGNNIGMKFALNFLNQDYILLLNNDTVVDNQFLCEMVKSALEDQKIGITGPKLLKSYNPQKIDSTGHIIKWGYIIDRGHGKHDRGQYDNKKEVMGAMAASSLYNKKMLVDIGLFNENYITNYEDAELSWRAYKKGWNALFVPKAIVYHKRGKSITKKSVFSETIILNTKNTIQTVKIYGTHYQKFLFAFALIKKSIIVLINRFLMRNKVDVFVFLKVVVDYFNIRTI